MLDKTLIKRTTHKTFALSKKLKTTALAITLFASYGYSQTTSDCDLAVALEEKISICPGDEVTLTPKLSGKTACGDDECTTLEVENTSHCRSSLGYVVWLKDENKNKIDNFANIDLVWGQSGDNATIKGTVRNIENDMVYALDVTYSGKKLGIKKFKAHNCYDEDEKDWVFYTEMSGTLMSSDSTFIAKLDRRGVPFQLGKGANNTEEEEGKYGASGWFDTSLDGIYGDININITPCDNDPDPTPTPVTTPTPATTPTATPASREVIKYLWSNGETTPTIKVNPEETTTYTVTVTGCDGCEATDSVIVEVPEVETKQEICFGESIVLKAAEGDSYEWSTGETTQSITATVPGLNPPGEATFTVKVKRANCEITQTMNISSVSCSSSNTMSNVKVSPLPATSGQELQVDLSSKANHDIQCALYDIAGSMQAVPINKTVHTGKSTFSIDTSNLEPGIYLLNMVEPNGSTSTKRIVITK